MAQIVAVTDMKLCFSCCKKDLWFSSCQTGFHLETPFFSASVMPSAVVSMTEAMKKLPHSFMTLAMYASLPIRMVPRPMASKYGCNLSRACAGPAGAQSTCPSIAAGGRPKTGAHMNVRPASQPSFQLKKDLTQWDAEMVRSIRQKHKSMHTFLGCIDAVQSHNQCSEANYAMKILQHWTLMQHEEKMLL